MGWMTLDSRYVRFVCGTVIIALLAGPAAAAMGPALGGVDIVGNNIRMVVVGTKEECSAACDAEPACMAATFVLPGTIQGPDGHCYLKSAATPQTSNFNCYSFEKLVIQPVFGCVMSSPAADFSAAAANTSQPPRGFAPLSVAFTDLSTGVSGGRTWDFGDGSPFSHDQNPVHTYTAGSPGGTYYDVTLIVLGACPGESSTKKREKVVRVFDNIGFLGITTTPAGASVFIDGSQVPGATSETFGEPLQLAPGTHAVRLVLAGYREVTADVVVENGKTTKYAVLLEPAAATPATGVTTPASPGTASLQVTTLPDGAAVSVDGAPRGTSPVTVPGLAAGSHTVVLAKAGYTDYTGTLTLAAGKTTMLNITLVALPGAPAATTLPPAATAPQSPAMTQSPVAAAPAGTGSLSVSSQPPGANVYLDGEKIGTAPVTVPGVAAGSHRLLLTLQGYADITRAVNVTAGQETRESVTFPAKKAPGFPVPAALGALALLLPVLQRRRRGR